MGAAASTAALGLGIGLAYSRLASGWSRAGAVLDADFSGGRFSFGGRAVAGKSAFLAAIGGTEAAGAISIGPFVAPDAMELIANGDFSAGDAGWTASQLSGGPSSAAVAAGEYTLSGNGANCPVAAQPVAVQLGHAYQVRGKVKRGSTNSPVVTVSSNAQGSSAITLGASNATTSYVETIRNFSVAGAFTTVYPGIRMIVNPATGSGVMDDFSMKEVVPYAGFAPAAVSGLIEATTPATASGDKVLWQIDDDGRDNSSLAGAAQERNFIRLYWDAGRHLHLLVTYQATIGSTTTQADLDLGVVELSTAFRVAFSCAPNSFIASLNGQPALSDGSGSFPGAAAMRLGRSQTGSNNWDGTIARVTVWSATRVAEELEQLSASSFAGLYAAWGDSLTASANASSGSTKYPAVASAAYDPDRPVSNQGIGGQTSTQIAARQGGQPLTVTVSGNSIPGSGGVAVTGRNINVLYNSGVFTGTLKGTLSGIPGTMSTDASGNWTFTRTLPGSAASCPAGSRFVLDLAVQLRQRTQWLWLGRNGAQSGYTVEDDIVACIAFLGHARYLVGSILTASNDSAGAIAAIQARNAGLATAYGARFVNLMAALAAANDGSANDLGDVAAGFVPRSLRSDAVHLNDAGYAIVAARFKAASDAMGW